MASAEWERFLWASLADKFNALPADLADLTDVQIIGVLLHKRDKDGRLVPPETVNESAPAPAREPTPENQLADVEMLAAMGLITPENAAQLRNKLKTSGPVEPAPERARDGVRSRNRDDGARKARGDAHR